MSAVLSIRCGSGGEASLRPRGSRREVPLVGLASILPRFVRLLSLPIGSGQCRFYRSDSLFPKKVWYEADGCIWMGFLINPGNGEYMGWPIGKEERDEVFGRLGGRGS